MIEHACSEGLLIADMEHKISHVIVAVNIMSEVGVDVISRSLQTRCTTTWLTLTGYLLKKRAMTVLG